MKILPPLILELLLAAFVSAACGTTHTETASAMHAASTSSGGQCTLEGSACSGHSECCSQWCANSECVRREP